MKYTVQLSDEEEKALLTDMLSIQEWLNNAIHNKARQCVDLVAEAALKDGTALTVADKTAIKSMMDAQGIVIISSVKSLPESIKYEIVKRAKGDVVKTGAEKNAELER